MKPHDKRPNADVNAKGGMLVRPWEKKSWNVYIIYMLCDKVKENLVVSKFDFIRI